MFWLTKKKFQKALDANGLIHDAIVMGISDKYIEEENLRENNFDLQLLGRAMNWAVPNLRYALKNDLDKVENEEFKSRFKQNENLIFEKGLKIVNSDSLIEKLVISYVAYEIYLISTLFPEDTEIKYPGIARLKKIFFQTTEIAPDVQSPDFKEKYKELFIKFNEKYGKYGKTLKQQTIDSLFSFLLA